ncbi:MAG: YigZ family protein [Rudanella sp.]|nr:YigZ family protein [Rudanella sp.]
MLFDDTFQTLTQATEGQFRDRGSRFLAFAYPICTETEAKNRLDTLRHEHPKANHHCYAYRLGLDKNQYRVSDDGEPSGSAGRPILNTIYGQDQPGKPFTDVLVVVVRYFGGTLLGVPGLINAYKMATADALANAQRETRTVNEQYQISFGFEQMNAVMRIVKESGVKILNQSFDTQCTLVMEIRKTAAVSLTERFSNLPGVSVEWIDAPFSRNGG